MKKFFALVALLCTVMTSSTALAANWVWIYSDDAQTIYVDNDSIRRDRNYSGYVFRAFVKWIYNDEGRNRVIEKRRASGQPLPNEIYNLADEVDLYYFKPGDGINYYDIVDAVYHSHDGNTIPELGHSRNEFQWDYIKPGTIGEVLYDKIRARVPN